jgi:hypothetical protein
MTRRGAAVNTALVESAALLHDLDKALPPGHPFRRLGHGAGGAEWMREHGHDELAEAIANHPVGVLAQAASYEDYARRVGLEACLVAYADKRALQDTVSLDARFDRWYGRYPDSSMLPVAHARAREMERDICAAAGIRPAEIERLPWVAQAMAQIDEAA